MSLRSSFLAAMTVYEKNPLLTWCLLNHSCSLLWLQQCPLDRVLSAPSPTSSVSGKNPEQQENTTVNSGIGSLQEYGLHFIQLVSHIHRIRWCFSDKFPLTDQERMTFVGHGSKASQSDGKVIEFYIRLIVWNQLLLLHAFNTPRS